MSTYAQVKARIADDLNRSDLTSQIAQQVLLAVDHYAHERFYFNEATSTLTATVGQSYVSPPSDMLVLDDIYITISGRNVRLIRVDLNDVIAYRPTTNGRPRSYCYYMDRFELDRPCDSAYSMPVYYVKELTALSADSDTNAWTTDGEDLIVARAEKMLYATVIKDQEKAAVAAALEKDALTDLRELSAGKIVSGYTRAYYL